MKLKSASVLQPYTMIGFHSIYFLPTVNSQNNTTNMNVSYPVEHKKVSPSKKAL